MSNTAVGLVYKRIIDTVADVSRTDFEENGVSNAVLQALQEKWQERLSASQRAIFPWDPQPVVQAPPAAPSAPKSNPAPAASSLATPAPSQQNGGTNIKQEPGGFDASFLNLPQNNYASGLNQPQYAHQRAAALIQQQFGQQGSGSIGALQAQATGLGMPGGRPTNGMQLSTQQQAQMMQQRVQQQQLQQQQRMQQAKQDPAQVKREAGVGNGALHYSQTDGAGDIASQWEATLVHRNAHNDDALNGRHAADRIIRCHVESMAQRLEGGGLLVPLDEHRSARGRQRTSETHTKTASSNAASSSSRIPSERARLSKPARFDGGDDSASPEDDDDDLDAINSDLDDSDDGLDNGIENTFEGDIILCLYDKVQRVKNKWKCTLKDGVVTVDGKDYVFHKAQGEFEW